MSGTLKRWTSTSPSESWSVLSVLEQKLLDRLGGSQGGHVRFPLSYDSFLAAEVGLQYEP